MERSDLDRRFDYHAPVDDLTVERHMTVRAACKTTAAVIDQVVPDGREKALAVTKLEEALMWANAGIARGQHG